MSWHAIPNIKNIEFDLISDADMHLFFEKSMRGGFFKFEKITVKLKIICQVSKPKARMKTYYILGCK